MNYDRFFNNDNVRFFLLIVFMIFEYFVNCVCYYFEWIKINVKLLVLDEVYKMFDWNFDFWLSYDFFKGVKDSFSCVFVMILIVILS